MPISNWLVWDRIREFARSNRIYQQERILQDQSALDRVTVGGEFLDFSAQSAILEQTNLQINRLERYKDFEQMDQTGEMSLGLDLYADAISLVDPERKHALIIRAADTKIKRELEELYYDTLLTDRWIRPASRYLCKFGDCPFEVVPDRNRSGVSSLRFMNVYNFTRLETRFGDLVGYFYQDDLYPEPIFLHPWACLHLRLTSLENIYAPYGRSILDASRKSFKQLRLMEDGALIYRITRAPEKRKYKIPVGLTPSKEIPEYMLSIARLLKRQRFYNPTTGTYDEKYSPIIQEDDFFLPMRPDGTGPDIETLPGAENLDQIADIEYFKKKMVAPLKIPYARVGIGEGAGEPNEKSLSQSDADFAKAIQWIQSELALGLTKVGIIHLALRGYPADAIRGFELSLASSSAIEDLYRMETWQTRVNVMADLKDIGWFPKEWIVTHFTDLSPDEIEELEEMEESETGGEGGGGGGGGGLGGGGGGLGGDLDMGGDMEGGPEGEGGEDAGPDGGMGGDMGGEGGDEEGGDEGGDEEEGDEISLESDDTDDRRLLMEVKRHEHRFKKAKIIRKFHDRRNPIRSCFKNLLESKELDGLSRTPVEKMSIQESIDKLDVHDPGDGDDVLVEWSVDPGERMQVIREVKALLMSGVDTGSLEGEEEILSSDLPD